MLEIDRPSKVPYNKFIDHFWKQTKDEGLQELLSESAKLAQTMIAKMVLIVKEIIQPRKDLKDRH